MHYKAKRGWNLDSLIVRELTSIRPTRPGGVKLPLKEKKVKEKERKKKRRNFED